MKPDNFIRDLFKARDTLNFLMSIKVSSYRDVSKKIDLSMKHPLAKKLIKEGGLPKSYQDIITGDKLKFTGNLDGELAWLVKSILPFSEEINKFFIYENEVEKSILMSDFDKAKKIIDDINVNVCYSFWSMEILFSLVGSKGDEKNWTLLKELNSNLKHPISQIFLEFYSKKAEKEVTAFQYMKDLENLISGLDQETSEYFLLNLGDVFNNSYKSFSLILFLSCKLSVIDKYLLLIEVLYHLSNDIQYHSLIENVLIDLDKAKITDFRINRLREIIVNKIVEDFNEEILSLFDIYSKGQYSESKIKSIELIKKYPTAIELYETYTKCIIELKEGYSSPNISSEIDAILKSLYELYSKGERFYEARENLIKYYLSFSKIGFFKQLISLVVGVSGYELTNNLIEKRYFFYSFYSNPNIITWDGFRQTLKFGDVDVEKHISLKINYALGKDNYEIIDKIEIPEVKKDLYKSRIGDMFEKQDISFLLKLISNENLSIFFYDEVLIYTCKVHLKEHNFSQLLTLLVNSYFKNTYLLKKLDLNSIVEIIINENYNIENLTLDLPIFFHIVDTSTYFLFASLDEYLTSISIEKPSEIVISENNELKEKQIFLLENVCSLAVLNNFYAIFENDDDVINERIKILRKLISINQASIDKYYEEIAFLLRKKSIDSTLQNYNDGKISLNFNRIKEDKNNNLEISFNRFIKLKNYSQKNNLELVEPDVLLNMYLSELETSPSNKLQDASYLAFKSIVFEATNLFLFSKEHGLDGDLSTRIRHGVLENQLRRVFSSNMLVSIKNNDIYNDIQYWKTLCEENEYRDEISNGIQAELKIFSEKIDDLILNIKNEYLQIQSYKHTKKAKGLFNYNFSEEFLWVAFNEVKNTIDDYSEFQNYWFSMLKTHTENILKKIASFIREEVNNEFNKIIDELDKMISDIPFIGGSVHSELKQKINYSKTQVGNELFEVSKWFKLTSYFDDSTLDIETIIHTALEIINYNSSIKIEPKIEIPENLLVENGYSYIEIFKILLENTIKHSKLSNDLVNLVICTSEFSLLNNNSILAFNIEVSNNTQERKEDVIPKVNYVVNNWNSSFINVNREGGSGYQKINRILKYDIKANDSNIKFNILEDSFKVILEIKLIYKPVNLQ
ncbi:hypothetical protein [Moheibacter sediminis]|uniref:Uncharacterized protein n=1 Tax=Moheibacter sediminis TaxID=1434700 RepID=A0A1W1YBN7_9FLAO|nr:hypothetical protein [Moheibacter sediminis]SMC33630.1 hypothetical protein SAMN06296427_101237 [Moheibacter sediminis]